MTPEGGGPGVSPARTRGEEVSRERSPCDAQIVSPSLEVHTLRDENLTPGHVLVPN